MAIPCRIPRFIVCQIATLITNNQERFDVSRFFPVQNKLLSHCFTSPLLGHYSNQEPIMFPNPLQIKHPELTIFQGIGGVTLRQIPGYVPLGDLEKRFSVPYRVGGMPRQATMHHGMASEHLEGSRKWFTTDGCSEPKKKKGRNGEQQLLSQGWKPTEKRTKKGNESPGNSIQIANSPKTKKMLNRKNDDLLGNP